MNPSIAEIFTNKSVLITGGIGFIGSSLARRLVGMGAMVTVLDSMVPEYGGNKFNLVGMEQFLRINISDMRDPYSISFLVDGQDYLFNLAGQTSHMESMSDPLTDLHINVTSQVSLLEACRRLNSNIRIVFLSTRQIYGLSRYLPVDELHPEDPVDVNGINKLASEKYHILYSKMYNMQCSILRLTNTYGPRMRIKDARQMFLGYWLRQLLEDKPFQVWGGEQYRDFTFVEDVVDAILLCASATSANGCVFNLGGPEVMTLKELADQLIAVNRGGFYNIVSFPENRKKIDIGDFYCNFNKIRNTLGWHPQTTILEGLERTLEYYRENMRYYI
ncbi:MAG: NAD-dependent epimerase/dehydratase family protein [Magnetococcales bacterium]|nr:NAD-dependent epimerase/dehydratase family protein [Magnetococcales bacterium]